MTTPGRPNIDFRTALAAHYAGRADEFVGSLLPVGNTQHAIHYAQHEPFPNWMRHRPADGAGHSVVYYDHAQQRGAVAAVTVEERPHWSNRTALEVSVDRCLGHGDLVSLRLAPWFHPSRPRGQCETGCEAGVYALLRLCARLPGKPRMAPCVVPILAWRAPDRESDEPGDIVPVNWLVEKAQAAVEEYGDWTVLILHKRQGGDAWERLQVGESIQLGDVDFRVSATIEEAPYGPRVALVNSLEEYLGLLASTLGHRLPLRQQKPEPYRVPTMILSALCFGMVPVALAGWARPAEPTTLEEMGENLPWVHRETARDNGLDASAPELTQDRQYLPPIGQIEWMPDWLPTVASRPTTSVRSGVDPDHEADTTTDDALYVDPPLQGTRPPTPSD